MVVRRSRALARSSSSISHIKVELKKLVRQATEPAVHIDKLPASVQACQDLRPRLMEAAYRGEESPIACPLSLTAICSLSQSFRCRGAAPDLQLQRAPSLHMQQLAAPTQQFAGVMMQGMMQMQTSLGGNLVTPVAALSFLNFCFPTEKTHSPRRCC